MGFSLTVAFAVLGVAAFLVIEIFTGALVPSISDFTDSWNEIKDRRLAEVQSLINITGIIDGVTGTWWNTSFWFRKNITIDHTKVAGDLTSFPVLIDITDADLKNQVLQSNGNDIAFVDSTHTTKYNHEIELYNSATGHLVTWVNVTAVDGDTDTVLYMYYGNASCENQQNIPDVWDSDYVMVQHLEESSGTIYDSTSYENDGINVGGDATFNSSSMIDGGYDFDGDGDSITISDSESLAITDQITCSAWVRLGDFATYNPIFRKGESCVSDINEDGIVDTTDEDILLAHYGASGLPEPHPRYDVEPPPNGDGSVGLTDLAALTADIGLPNPPLWYLQISDLDDTGTSYCYFYLNGTSTPRLVSTRTFSSADIGTWYHLVAVYNGTHSLLYINGELDASQENSGTIDVVSDSLYIGADNYRYNWNGTLDEFRISHIPRSDAWINTSYANQDSPSTFYTLGDQIAVYLTILIENTGSISLGTQKFSLLVNGTKYQCACNRSCLFPLNEIQLYATTQIATGAKQIKVISEIGNEDEYNYTG